MTDHDDDPGPILAQAEELRDLLQGRYPYDLLGPTSVIQFARSMVADLVDLIVEEEAEDDLDVAYDAAYRDYDATEREAVTGTVTWGDVLRAWDREEELDARPVLPPIATDERGRIIPMSDAEWAARSEALSRALRSAGSRTDEDGSGETGLSGVMHSVPRCLGGMRDEGGVDLVGDEGLNL